MQETRKYRYGGPLVKVYAGGYVFKRGQERDVSVSTLRPLDLAQFAEWGIVAVDATPTPEVVERVEDTPTFMRRGRGRSRKVREEDGDAADL